MIEPTLPADIDLLDLHRLAPARYPVLLESSATGAHGRRDLLLAHAGEGFALHRDGVVRTLSGEALAGGFFDVLDRQWQAAATGPGLPLAGGWALLLGYELAAQVEPVLALPQAEGGLPVAIALRCPAVVLRDRGSGELRVCAEADSDAWRLRLAEDIERARALAPLPAWAPPRRIDEDEPQRYLDGVARVLDYLAAGDVFQANLSRGWKARFDGALDPAALFQRLRQHNPAPFAGLFRSAWGSVVSASPERLLSVRAGVAETRPIAGTRARFPGDDDAARIRELVGHPKERAEHVMLLDLERNDLGRVCAPGSVQVDELMTVESYAHVHHIVSNVRGQLRAEVTPGQALAALFPGGTITGCPKVRCMQIVAELEGVGRGAYTGAMGWLGHDGDMDLNILIRSAEVEGDTLRFRTGAGIVIDSDPQRELEETRAKARGMLRALGCE
ncbi:aminodeoxychorismate synthase component I [Thermomonas fusca]|uniref:Aminodeoxychorismate synthase component I n=1 Tax=Thermomonas fusca TaxID=215690 RepID=A0A5R9PE77_9GAMM|nr:aminodeoxychorismate synthase component I [Thermomonas fusca]TLX21814.1 aminodeoxychorismate synthase component I [Thermomonas fusca]